MRRTADKVTFFWLILDRSRIKLNLGSEAAANPRLSCTFPARSIVEPHLCLSIVFIRPVTEQRNAKRATNRTGQGTWPQRWANLHANSASTECQIFGAVHKSHVPEGRMISNGFNGSRVGGLGLNEDRTLLKADIAMAKGALQET